MAEENEIVFNSSDEALQKLADMTGKKVMVPAKAEPTVAEDEEAVVADNGIPGTLRKEGEKKGKAIQEAYDNAADSLEKSGVMD